MMQQVLIGLKNRNGWKQVVGNGRLMGAFLAGWMARNSHGIEQS